MPESVFNIPESLFNFRRNPRSPSSGIGVQDQPKYAVAEHPEHPGRHERVTDRGHLVGVAGGPRPAETEAARPKPELLRPLDEYAAVAGGTF